MDTPSPIVTVGLKCEGPFDSIVENIAVFVTDEEVFILNQRSRIVRIHRWPNCDCRLLAHTSNWRLFNMRSEPEPRILAVVERGRIPQGHKIQQSVRSTVGEDTLLPLF